MIIIYLSTFIFLITNSVYVKRSLFTPIVIFAFCWCIFPAISEMEIAGLFKPSLHTHICIIVAISSFFLTYLILNFYFQGNCGIKNNTHNYVNTKALVIANIISWFFLLPYTIAAIDIYKSFGLVYLRDYSTTEQLVAGTQLQTLYNWLIVPLYLVTAIFACLLIVDGKSKDNKELLLVSITSILLHSITFAARALLVKYIFYFVFASFFCNAIKKSKIRKKDFLKMFSVIFGLLFVIVLISKGRSDKTLFDSFITYYAGPFSLFDYYLSHPQTSYLVGSSYLFGKALLGFLYNILQSALYVVFGKTYLGSDYIITRFTAQVFPVGKSISMNAASTAMYPFMRDFGYFGLIIGFSFMAFLICWSEYKVKNRPSYRNRAVYVLLLYVLFKLSMSYEMLSPSVTFTVLYIIIATHRFKIISKR